MKGITVLVVLLATVAAGCGGDDAASGPITVYSGREEELVADVLRSGRLSLGPTIDRFEEAFAEAVGAPYAAAVSSGTAGLHLLCVTAGVGPGDEVVTSPYSFVASANCAIMRSRYVFSTARTLLTCGTPRASHAPRHRSASSVSHMKNTKSGGGSSAPFPSSSANRKTI